MSKKLLSFNKGAAPKGLVCELSPMAFEIWQKTPKSLVSAKSNAITMFDVIGEDYWGGGITPDYVASELDRIGPNNHVEVYINSPGGNVFDGFTIYNMLAMHPGGVTVKVIGVAASAASVIAMAGESIEIAKAAFIMVHNSWIGAQGNKHDLRAVADFLEPFDAAMIEIFADKTGLDNEAIVALLDAETWLNGAQAKEKGFADAIIDGLDYQGDDLPPAENAARLIDVTMAKAGIPRSERRRILASAKEFFKGDTHNAITEADTQNAVATGELLNLTKSLFEVLK